MPWGSKSSSYRRHGGGGGTTSWNTAGETASLKNACLEVGITEEDVVKAGGIECQWRSCYGNSVAIVKLSDMYALKKRIRDQEAEEKKQALIDQLGKDGYELCTML